MAAAPPRIEQLENDITDPVRQECRHRAVDLLLTRSTQRGGAQRFRGAVTALKEQIAKQHSAEMRETAEAIIYRVEREDWRKSSCRFRRHVLVLLVVLGVDEEEIEALRKQAHITPKQRAEGEEIHSASMSLLRDEAERRSSLKSRMGHCRGDGLTQSSNAS